MSTLLDLTRMDQVPVGFTLDAMQSLRNSQATDSANLQDLYRKQAHEAEMDPLRVQQAQLANLGAGQRLSEGEYGLASLGRKDTAERELFGPSQQAKLKELLANASENEHKMFENELYTRLQNTRPGTPAHAAATKALEATKSFQVEQRKHRHALEIAAANNATQLRLEQMRIDAGKYAKANTLRVGFEYELSKADNAIKVNAVITKYLAIAQADPDYAPLIPTLNAMLERNKSSYDAEADLRRRTGEGGVDLRGFPNIPTVPTKPTTQTPLPTTPQPAAPAASAPTKKLSGAQAEDWIARAMKANKGMTREQVMEEGRKAGKL